jgi:cysteinyl-tRNA synthetase
MNISAAWGAIFEAVAHWNRLLSENGLTATEAASALAAWRQLDRVLGLGVGRKSEPGEAGVPQELSTLLVERQAARQAKNFKRADAIRDELKSKGWVIEDTAKGARLKRL